MAKKTALLALILGLYFGTAALPAHAASLLLSPQSGTYSVGNTFSVSVVVSSPDQNINAFSGDLSFPSDKLQVIGISKQGIATLWAQEPGFDNSLGTASFEGVVLNPGYQGNGGVAITITFRAKSAGTATVGFSNGSVLANDGSGTNVLDGMGKAVFVIGSTAPQSTTPVSAAAGSSGPAAMRIFSSTHPKSDTWYANANPKFSWVLPDDIAGVRVQYDHNPLSRPGVLYEPAISDKSLSSLGDGMWYFHLQAENAQGWGDISHYEFRIDTEPPKPFDIQFPNGTSSDDPRPTVVFGTSDKSSGVAKYLLSIDGGDTIEVSAGAAGKPYELPLQKPGTKTLKVVAVDRANNSQTATAQFTVIPIPGATLDPLPAELSQSEPLVVTGSAAPGDTVMVHASNEDSKAEDVQQTKTDGSGHFSLVVGHLKGDVNEIWAEVQDSRGASSLPTDHVKVLVKGSAIMTWGLGLMQNMGILIALLALIFALAYVATYGWTKMRRLRKRLKSEMNQADVDVHARFDAMKEGMAKKIMMLEEAETRRELTAEEIDLMESMKRDLSAAEKMIRHEIASMEDEVK